MMKSSLWRLAELSERVAQELNSARVIPANGQIAAVPNPRTIRYYTTLGLLDPPTEMRGRTAFYGRKHLLQLLAIKRLQAKGQSLADIQEQLPGAEPKVLEALASASDDDQAPKTSTVSTSTRATSFWERAPSGTPVQIRERRELIISSDLSLLIPSHTDAITQQKLIEKSHELLALLNATTLPGASS